MPPTASRPDAPVCLLWGEDEFTVQRRAREKFAAWHAGLAAVPINAKLHIR